MKFVSSSPPSSICLLIFLRLKIHAQLVSPPAQQAHRSSHLLSTFSFSYLPPASIALIPSVLNHKTFFNLPSFFLFPLPSSTPPTPSIPSLFPQTPLSQSLPLPTPPLPPHHLSPPPLKPPQTPPSKQTNPQTFPSHPNHANKVKTAPFFPRCSGDELRDWF